MSYYVTPPVQDPNAETEQGKAIRKSLGSGIFLVAVIGYTINLICGLYTALNPQEVFNSVLSSLTQFLTYADLESMGISSSYLYSLFSQVPSGYTSYMVICGLAILIPTMLMTLALWLVWAGARKKAPTKGTAGLTILQVFAVISLIGLVLSTLIMIGLMIPAISYSKEMDAYLDMGFSVSGLIIVGFIFLIAVLIFNIVYFAKLNTLYSNAKALSRNERVRKKASLFVIVIGFFQVISSFISAGTGLVGMISTVAYNSTYGTVNSMLFGLANGLSTIAFFVYELFLVITFIKLRSVEEPFTRRILPQPMYMQQPVNVQQPLYGQQPMYGQPMMNPQQLAYGQPVMNAQQTMQNGPMFGQPAFEQPSASPMNGQPMYEQQPMSAPVQPNPEAVQPGSAIPTETSSAAEPSTQVETISGDVQ